jgi:hypothetical protein
VHLSRTGAYSSIDFGAAANRVRPLEPFSEPIDLPAIVKTPHAIDLPKSGRDAVTSRTDLALQNYFARIWAD